MEIWKPIKYFPGYEVSSFGRFKAHNKIRKWDYSLNKYITVRITNNSASINKYLHVLVIEAFIQRPEYPCEVNHKDCNKSNNCIENLEYLTHEENMEHARFNGQMDYKTLKGSEHPLYGTTLKEETKSRMKASHNKNGKHPNYVLTDSQVYEIKKRRFEGSEMEVLAIEFKQTVANISFICSGKRRAKIAPEYTIPIKKYRKAKRNL